MSFRFWGFQVVFLSTSNLEKKLFTSLTTLKALLHFRSVSAVQRPAANPGVLVDLSHHPACVAGISQL